MEHRRIIKRLLQENIGRKIQTISKKSQKKKYDLLFLDTIYILVQSNANDQLIQKLLYLYSLYRSCMQKKSKNKINHYIEKENELHELIENTLVKGGNTFPVVPYLNKESIDQMYLLWIKYQKQVFSSQQDIFKGGNSLFSISSMDSIASDLFFKIGVVYGSLLQLLKDIQDDIPKDEINLTGFVDDNNQLVPLLKLTKYAATIVSTIDSAVRVFLNQSNYDMRLLKPVLDLVGVNFQNIEGNYQNVVQCFEEIQNILEKKGFQDTIVNTTKMTSDAKSFLSNTKTLSSNAKTVTSNLFKSPKMNKPFGRKTT